MDFSSSMSDCHHRVHVVAIPYPGRGHINAMLNSCRLLAPQRPGLLITLLVTEQWLALILEDLQQHPRAPALPSNIHLRTIPNVLPSETTRTDNFHAFFEAVFTKMEPPVASLLDHLHNPPAAVISCIIADTLLPWAVALGNQRSIPVASLWPMSSTAYSIFNHAHLLRAHGHHPINVTENGDTSVCYFPGVSSIRLGDLPNSLRGRDSPVLPRLQEAVAWVPKAQCLLLASFQRLEPNATDAIKAHLHRLLPVYAVGPFISSTDPDPNGCSNTDYCQWLDSKAEQTVLYVSFGSYLGVSGPQLEEIAVGLRASGVHFLWASGRADRKHLQEVCGEKGLVVAWCDQLRVLCHPSIRAFFTHCGWNSTMEAVFAGVVMLAFPLGAEQYTNAKLIVEDWKVGVRVKREMLLGSDDADVVGREEIAGIVKRVMDLEGNEGREMKRRAEQLQESCRTAIGSGGSSNTNINAFVREFLFGHFSSQHG
ncbi:hypothetical protein ACLOJK_000285 [Asimina triloba]